MNYNFETMTDEELVKLANTDISMWSIEEQKEFKLKLSEERERRKGIFSKNVENQAQLLVKKESLENKVKDIMDRFGPDIESGLLPGMASDVSKLNEQIKDIESKLVEGTQALSNDDSVIKQVSTAVKSARFSIMKKRLDNGKKAVARVPQKICDLKKSVLNHIRTKANKLGERSLQFSKKVETKFDEFETKNNDTLNAINSAMEDLFNARDNINGSNLTAQGKYLKEKEANKGLKRLSRKYDRTFINDAIISTKLRPGIVRMLKLPSNIISKINKPVNDDAAINPEGLGRSI